MNKESNESINYIQHLNELFALFDVDNRITVYHTALYLAIFRLWNANHFVSPLRINRAIIMKMSKISSTKTYSKTIEELSQWGYVEYSPTNTKLHPSYVHMFTTRLLGKRVMPHLYKHINNKYINIGQKEIFDFEEENETIPTEIPKEEIRRRKMQPLPHKTTRLWNTSKSISTKKASVKPRLKNSSTITKPWVGLPLQEPKFKIGRPVRGIGS